LRCRDRGPELPQRRHHGPRRRVAEAEEQPARDTLAERVRRDGTDPQPAAACRRHDRVVVDTFGQPGHDVEPGGAARERPDPFHLRRPQQRLAPLGVERPHAPDMSAQMPIADEGGGRRLQGGRHVPAHGRAHGQRRVEEPPRRHQEAQPHAGSQELAQRPHIDHPPAAVAVQRLQGRHRGTVVAELAVVVVLDDEPVRRLRPFQELEPAGEARHRAERVLVGRRHHREPRLGCQHPPGRDRDPLAVHRHRRQLQSRRQQRPARRRVAGVLDPGPLAGIGRRHGGDHDGFQRARGHDHLPGLGCHPARRPEIGRERLP
jgi:hypothetical protein